MTTISEIAHLRGRMRTSLVMAAAATGPCAQMAHQKLARLYGEEIDALSARMLSKPLPLDRPMIASWHQETFRHVKITDDATPIMATV